MKNVPSLIMLLVCVLHETAHAFPYVGHWDTFQSRTKRSERSIQAISSSFGNGSVTNLHTLCEEVCGKEFRGPGCGAHCDPTNVYIHNSIAQNIFKSVCPIVCTDQLDYQQCFCPRKVLSNFKRNRNILCELHCQATNRTLNGCPVCLLESIFNQEITATSPEGHPPAPITSTVLHTPNKSKPPTSAEEPDSSSSSEKTTTVETTPDWNELCNSLCKTGDGGALCECDIPPLDVE